MGDPRSAPVGGDVSPVREVARRRYAPRLPPAERREQLLDAALEIIAAEGYGAISIEAVARRAGVSRPVVYGLFSDLRTLLEALLEREEERALRQLGTAVPIAPGDRELDELVVEGVLTFLRAVAENPLTWRLILLPVQGTPSSLRERVGRSRGAVIEQVERLVAWALERRGGPPGLDVELIARIIVVLGEEAGRLVLTDPERFPPERHARVAATLTSSIESGPGGHAGTGARG
jgi:AcrR family transcriptional regulator